MNNKSYYKVLPKKSNLMQPCIMRSTNVWESAQGNSHIENNYQPLHDTKQDELDV